MDNQESHFIRQFAALTTEDHEPITVAGEDLLAPELELIKNGVIWFQSSRRIETGVAMQRISKVLNGPNKFTLTEIRENVYLIRFTTATELEMAIESAPWVIQEELIIIQKCKPDLAPADHTFDKVWFWTQFHGIPLRHLNGTIINRLAGSLGNFTPTTQEEVSKWSVYGRAKVEYAIDKPLPKRVNLRLSNTQLISVELRIEKLPRFCASCGFIGHSLRFCSIILAFGDLLKQNLSLEQRSLVLKAMEPKYNDNFKVPFMNRFPPKEIGSFTRQRLDAMDTDSNRSNEEVPADNISFTNKFGELLTHLSQVKRSKVITEDGTAVSIPATQIGGITSFQGSGTSSPQGMREAEHNQMEGFMVDRMRKQYKRNAKSISQEVDTTRVAAARKPPES